MTENKRLKCRSCGYPMKVLEETRDGYQCYCAECQMDRYVKKYSLKQFIRDIERGKAIDEDLIIGLISRLEKENEQLRKDLIDHSALIKMLEDSKALDIEDIIWNSRGFESQEQFNEVYKLYLFNAKEKWK